MAIYHQILVPIDGCPISEKALDEATRLARLMGVRLKLLHGVDELDYVAGFESAMNYANEIIQLMRRPAKNFWRMASRRLKARAACRQCAHRGGTGVHM